MAPKSKKRSPPSDPNGMFSGMVVFAVDSRVQPRRLQIWKQRLEQMGASIEEKLSKNVTHIFAMDSEALVEKIGRERLSRVNRSILAYQWLEDSLSSGEKPSEDAYILTLNPEKISAEGKFPERNNSITKYETSSSDVTISTNKKIRCSLEESETATTNSTNDVENDKRNTKKKSSHSSPTLSPVKSGPATPEAITKLDEISDSALPCSPPDQNRNITEIFGKLINIYRALGDDRRSFSYYKAVAVIEKLPFKIESVDQVKHLPAIGKSLQDHIQEIVNTGRLSKLDHFETDEKVRTISLFGEVWGIGPATALKLYEKGYRTLDDLRNEDSLTNSQRLGLDFFDDIKTRIPRDEVREMEILLQKAAVEILPGVEVVCGGSYRRGKPTCGDMDIVITHPDGKSHKGFLRKFVRRLKDINFLREDLVFSIHSEEGTDSGVDTYFGLCTYPGRELRHRIDLKVYPRDIHAFGLIAWTGNDVLNRRLRIIAEGKGFRLDDTGLFPSTHGSGDKRGTRASRSLHLKTEREVLDFLGFPWLEPYERNL